MHEQSQSISSHGFSNPETWVMSFWLHEFPERQGFIDEANDQQGGIKAKAAWLEQELEELLRLQLREMGDDGVWNNLLGIAFNNIKWEELVH